MFKSKIEVTVLLYEWAIGHAGVYAGKAKTKRCVLRCFLKVATEVTEWTDNVGLFQKDKAQERKAFAPVMVSRD